MTFYKYFVNELVGKGLYECQADTVIRTMLKANVVIKEKILSEVTDNSQPLINLIRIVLTAHVSKLMDKSWSQDDFNLLFKNTNYIKGDGLNGKDNKWI